MPATITRPNASTSRLEVLEEATKHNGRKTLTPDEAWEMQLHQYHMAVLEVCPTYTTARSNGTKLPNSCRECKGVKFQETCRMYRLYRQSE